MTPEELEEHKQLVADIRMDWLSGNARHWGAGEVAQILFAEIGRAQAEAWDDCADAMAINIHEARVYQNANPYRKDTK